MPLPAGFKVNGSKTDMTRVLVPPRVKKIMSLLDKLPSDELFTSNEVSARAGLSIGGAFVSHPGLTDYREKVDGRLFWGSRKSIAQLRKKLAESEESHDEN